MSHPAAEARTGPEQSGSFAINHFNIPVYDVVDLRILIPSDQKDPVIIGWKATVVHGVDRHKQLNSNTLSR
jgi:hypothetical protein